ncbi:glycosyltransferase family 4 protein [Nitrosomonas supralitoralis]|uniref:Glycosyl transferase n=1 Tax=Nitrosomonas supralitoralis TaxID=2116706 RepID=A0A2P7NWX9_9PROT|nr:glycosyltransferase [Nitrosomonas supralitoralis]PSJ17972.1 glycosyl transferase [Nitrosomonas supralitoralis]
MNVIHIIIGLNVGGAEMMLKRLVDSHHDNPAFRHAVVSLTDMGKLGVQFQAMGVVVHSLGLGSSFGIPLVLWRLVNLIRALRPDIIQAWMYHADLLGGLAARMAGNRHVIWGIRTTDVQAGGSLMTVLVRWLCARFSRWVPQVIVCAAEASRQSHIAVGYDATKMVVVPNGYDFSQLSASADERKTLREQSNINQNDVVVGSLGRFHAVKDQENFVRMAGLLASQYPQLRFLMVGRGLDWDNAPLVDWIDKAGCKERFVLLGERKDVPQCLAAMDIFCLHSRTEGFPNVLAEAMAMGLPCITTDVGDAAMLLADTGVVVPKGDSAALAQGVARLLALEQDARNALGLRAKAQVEEEYSMDHARKRFEEIYRQVLNKGAF